MAYGRRKSYRRGNKRYSRWRYGRLIRNRSSTAQAGQIAALNKRVNGVYRKLKPDTQIWYSDYKNYIFNNSALSSVYSFTEIGPKNFHDAANHSMVFTNGDSHKIYNARIFGTIEYSDNYVSNPAIDHQRTCSFRVIVAQRLQSGTSSIDPSSILQVAQAGPGYELQAVAPLRDNCTATVRILTDRHYTFSDQYPVRNFSISLNKLRPFRCTSDNGEYPQGDIIVYFVSAGLHWDSVYSQQLNVNWGMKLAMPEVDIK